MDFGGLVGANAIFLRLHPCDEERVIMYGPVEVKNTCRFWSFHSINYIRKRFILRPMAIDGRNNGLIGSLPNYMEVRHG